MDCNEFVNRWRNWIRPFVIAMYLILLLIALPLMVVEFQVHKLDTHIQAWFVGGVFVCMAVPISMWGILQHLVHYTNPYLQRHIIRILWMVPIYAADAWFALRFKDAAIYLDTMRECYEAYVIYNFMIYLLSFLRSEFPRLEDHIATKSQVNHLFPFCFFPPWPMGKDLITHCKHGVLQYTVIRPLMTAVALICQVSGVYKEGDFNPKAAWLYVMFVNNISQIWAMYCLVLFYKATREELQPLKPIAKFMCVKAVVFMSFWQQVLIALLVQVGVITDKNSWLKDDIATALQDFCICVEMFFAAVAHYWSFSHQPYVDPMAEQAECCSSFLSMWDVSDVRDDVYEHVRHVGKTVTRPLRTRLRGRGENERTPLLQGNESEDEVAGFSQSAPGSSQAYTDPALRGPALCRGELTTSIGTIGSFGESTEYQSDKKSLTASMVNYADFGESGTQVSDTERPQMQRSVSNQNKHISDQTLPKEVLIKQSEEEDKKAQLEENRNNSNEEAKPDIATGQSEDAAFDPGDVAEQNDDLQSSDDPKDSTVKAVVC